MDISRLSACSYPLRQNNLNYTLQVIANSGFNKVDLLGTRPHFSINEAEYSIDYLVETADRYGVKIANLGTYCGGNFSSKSKAEREADLAATRKTIDIAHRLGARTIRVRPGSNKQKVMDIIIPYFQKCAEYAESKTIYMGIENHSGGISGNPELCAKLAEKVDSKHFGILYDPCNLMAAGVDYQKAFKVFSNYIIHVHLKDGTGQKKKFQATMLGDGDIDVRWVVENLEAIGYNGDFAIEYEMDHIEPVETGLRKWFNYFKSIISIENSQ